MLPKFREALEQLDKIKLRLKINGSRISGSWKLDKQKLIDDQRLFEEQKAAFQKQQDDQALKLKEENDAKLAEEKILMQLKTTARGNALMEIGMTYNLFADGYMYQDITVTITDLQELTDEILTKGLDISFDLVLNPKLTGAKRNVNRIRRLIRHWPSEEYARKL